MPSDGLTLGFAARELDAALSGGRVERVTQPEKDALILLVRAKGRNHKLLLCASPSFARAHITQAEYQNPMEAPMFCMLMRKHLTGARVLKIEQLSGDRVLRVALEGASELGDAEESFLYLETMGRYSNLTLVKDGRIIDAIRHVTDDMSRVRQALPGLPFIMPPAQDKLPPDASADEIYARLSGRSGTLDRALADILSGLSGASAAEIAYRLTGRAKTDIAELDVPALSQRLAELLRKLPELADARVLYDDAGAPVDVFAFPYLSRDTAAQKAFPTLSLALDAHFAGRDKRERMHQRSSSLRRTIKTHLERCEKKLALQEEELRSAERMEEYRVLGELLTANLHAIAPGRESVSVFDYYAGETREIVLDKLLSPAQNAQKYYKRYQKARSARKTAFEQRELTLAQISLLENAAEDAEKCETEEDLMDVRDALIAAGFLRRQGGRAKQRRPESKPLSFIAPDGARVSVGKNGAQNERLTQGADGEDVWLHAKDMPGSHVIVHCAGAPVSEETLLFAARLAGYYSKGRGVSVPVDYTLRKYVKKPGGAPAGFVRYTHQRTLVVSMTDSEARACALVNKK